MSPNTSLAPHLAEPTRIGDEISITGKWVPSRPGGRFRTSEESREITKGTADRYKKDIDRVAEPERYFFRGPVSWTIRTYSMFMHLPATYSSREATTPEPAAA